jgi:hypothetical protein
MWGANNGFATHLLPAQSGLQAAVTSSRIFTRRSTTSPGENSPQNKDKSPCLDIRSKS